MALVLLVHGESADAAHLVIDLRQGTLAASRRAVGCMSPGVCARPGGDPAEGHRSYHISAAASPELHLVITLADEDPDDATEYVYLDAGRTPSITPDARALFGDSTCMGGHLA